MQIVECIPNFSEGRDLKVIEKIADSIRAVPEVKLLDYSWDTDHNRSVFTFIGTPKGIVKAAYDSAEMALDLIDINKHGGVHPRLGAVDVIPFVPLKGLRMKDCVKLATQLGYELETHLHLPVYFYGEATTEKAYKNLANLRRDAHNLKTHRTGGAVCVGARDMMVAFNINLKSNDIEDAKKMIRLIREQDKLSTCIKLLPLYLPSKNCVQVSTWIVNPKKCPVEKVKIEMTKISQTLHIPILEFEQIGLTPEQVQKAVREFRV